MPAAKPTGTINSDNPDVAQVAAGLADACHAGGLSKQYYRTADDALMRIAWDLDDKDRQITAALPAARLLVKQRDNAVAMVERVVEVVGNYVSSREARGVAPEPDAKALVHAVLEAVRDGL